MTITDALVRVFGTGSGICFLATLVLYGIGRIGGGTDGMGEKAMVGTLIAAVAFLAAAGFVGVNGPTWFAGYN